MHKLSRSLAVAAGLLVATALPAAAQVKAVASIKPIHSLLASVMQGVGEPDLIIEGSGSPHTYSLRPSTARKIAEADLVFWIGPELENFLTAPLENLANKATIVELSETPGLITLPFREGGDFESHRHADHAQVGDDQPMGQHDGHDHLDHADHDAKQVHNSHDEHGANDGHKAHEEHNGHGHKVNMHIWLDPDNAILMTSRMEQALAKLDPQNKDIYARNAENTINALQRLTGTISEQLRPYNGKRFIVFHDAYEYFEKRFGLTAAGSLTVSPEVLPGARRLSEIRQKISDLNITCVFSEPQFNPKIVQVVTEGTGANTEQLDPLGAELEPGPMLYIEVLKNMSAGFQACLK